MKPSLVASTIAALLLGGCHVITDAQMTDTAISATFYRIHLFMQKEGAAPESLEVLPHRVGYGNRTTDGWGRELAYTISSDGILTLTSLGCDGETGGTGEDRDVSRSYRTVDQEGKSIIRDSLWIVTAEITRNSEQGGAEQPPAR